MRTLMTRSMSRINMRTAPFAKPLLVGATLLFGSFATASVQASMVNGTIFSDDFDGSALNAIWMPPGSPEVDPTSSLTVGGSLVTMVGGDADYNYVSMWGDVTQLAGLGASTDWWAEVSFRVSGSMSTPDSTRPINLLSGRPLAGGIGNNTGVDFRIEQDGTGAAGGTFNLSWAGFDDANLGQVATIIATGLNKDAFYTVSAHRKSDGNVDIFLDSSLITTQAVLGASNPPMFRIGESSGSASLLDGSLALDFVKVGELVPEPSSMWLLSIGGLSLLAYSWKKRK